MVIIILGYSAIFAVCYHSKYNLGGGIRWQNASCRIFHIFKLIKEWWVFFSEKFHWMKSTKDNIYCIYSIWQPPLKLWVHYVIKFVSDLRHVGGFLRVLRFPPPTKQTATIYNCNIVESGIKHHKPTNQTINLTGYLPKTLNILSDTNWYNQEMFYFHCNKTAIGKRFLYPYVLNWLSNV